MEIQKDTVIISIKDYNELRDFNEAIKRGDTVTNAYYGWKFYKPDEACKELNDVNNSLRDNNHELTRLLEKYKTENPFAYKAAEITSDEIKKEFKSMTPREFRKWKKTEMKKKQHLSL